MPSLYRTKRGKAHALALALALTIGSGLAQSASKAKAHLPETKSDKITDFDAARAYNHVKKMVELGPHPSGSEAIKKAQEYWLDYQEGKTNG